jgi:hypothetical protein
MEASVAQTDYEVLAITIPEAGRLLGLGRNAAYAAAARGEIPTMRYGPKIKRVPLKLFQQMHAAPAAILDQPTKPEA